MLVIIAAGTGLAAALGLISGQRRLELASFTLIAPHSEATAPVDLAIAIYLVTMASQNLPGAGVLRASGYEPPLTSALLVTRLASLPIAPLGARSVKLAAITAAICNGPDRAMEDRACLPRRLWGARRARRLAGGAIRDFPAALIKPIAGLGLIGSLAAALGTALADERQRFAGVLAFAVTASGITPLGIGAAFWGLVVGLLASALEGRVAVARAK
jgi:benzoate membrane transport protein